MRIATASVVLGLLACTPNDPPARTEAAPTRVAAPVKQPEAPVEPAVEPTKEAAPATDDPVVSPETPAPAEAPADMHVVALRSGDLHVFDLGGELFVGGAGVLARRTAEGSLERLDALRGLVDPGPTMLSSWNLVALGGRWPDPVWMQTQVDGQRSSAAPHMYYRKGDRWQRKATAVGPLHWFYAMFAPLPEDRVVALRMHAPDPGYVAGWEEELPPAKQRKLDAAVAANPPRLDLLAAGAAPVAAAMRLAPNGLPLALASAPTGELYVLLRFSGEQGDEGAVSTYAVQRFAPGASDGVVDPLTDLVDAPGALAVRASDDVLVGGHGTLARFDGRGWSKLAGPQGRVIALSLGEPGVRWAIAGNPDYDDGGTTPETALWRQTGAGAWTRVTLARVPATVASGPRWVYDAEREDWRQIEPETGEPLSITPQQLVVRGRGDVWVAGLVPGLISESGHAAPRNAVLHTRRPARVLELPDDGTLRGELLDVLAAKPWRPGDYCEGAMSPWVMIERLGPGATADAGLAEAIKAALPEALQRVLVSVRESKVEGHRVLGLFADPPDAPAVKQILAALDGLRPGVERRFECRNPRPIAELARFD